jgi:hypothetical protein
MSWFGEGGKPAGLRGGKAAGFGGEPEGVEDDSGA